MLTGARTAGERSIAARAPGVGPRRAGPGCRLASPGPVFLLEKQAHGHPDLPGGAGAFVPCGWNQTEPSTLGGTGAPRRLLRPAEGRARRALALAGRAAIITLARLRDRGPRCRVHVLTEGVSLWRQQSCVEAAAPLIEALTREAASCESYAVSSERSV